MKLAGSTAAYRDKTYTLQWLQIKDCARKKKRKMERKRNCVCPETPLMRGSDLKASNAPLLPKTVRGKKKRRKKRKIPILQ